MKGKPVAFSAKPQAAVAYRQLEAPLNCFLSTTTSMMQIFQSCPNRILGPLLLLVLPVVGEPLALALQPEPECKARVIIALALNLSLHFQVILITQAGASPECTHCGTGRLPLAKKDSTSS